MSAVFSAIFPVFLVAGAGYAIRRWRPLDTRTLSTLNIYLFIPALVFGNLSKSEIAWSVFARYAIGATLMVLAMTAILSVVARGRRLSGELHSAFLMTMFPNLGNFGLPVCKFAFGDTGLALAVVVMVCGSFLQNSVGVYFAHRSRHGVGQALKQVFQLPMVYAFALALVFQNRGWALPDALSRGIMITADAAIPVQLAILGIQLAETNLQRNVNVFLAGGLRLLAGPIVAATLALLLGMHGLTGSVFILQMSGPVAVSMAVYGVQFDVRPGYLASVVSWSFLLSLFTVGAVLYTLGAFPL